MILTLHRIESGVSGTFGKLEEWYTVELPWAENTVGKSCIPVGEYKCIWAVSPRLRRYTYRLVHVDNREGILIHSANFAQQLLGCIALGERLGYIDGKKAVLYSKPAVRNFEEFLHQKSFTLKIVEDYNA